MISQPTGDVKSHPIAEEVKRLKEVVDKLASVVKGSLELTAPVLQPEPPTPSRESAGEESARANSDLAIQIRMIRENLSDSIDDLIDMNRRIEL